ncbi:MAG: VWA domain-containing protein [Planctomycetota bacterium]
MAVPHNQVPHGHRFRRGAIAPMVAVSLPMLIVMAGFSINLAYMELTRGQLRVSCDSAAKAALVRYGTWPSGASQAQSDSRTFARTVSANNLVANQSVTFSDANIVFGNSTKNGSGIYVFTSGGTPSNGVQVTGTVNPPLLLAAFLPLSNFTTSQTSVATRISHDIVLVLDRSASMAFDLSSSEFVYPSDRSSQASMLQCYFTPPSTTASRWKALSDAVTSFVSTLQARNLDVHVALVTYSEDYTFGSYTSVKSSLDVPLTSLTSILDPITPVMTAWNQKVLLGDTNIEAGLTTGQTELTGARSRIVADRTIILLTDGVPTSGNTNIPAVVQNLRQNSQIMTHVITFGGQAASGTVQTSMQSAATAGNGMFFNAPTAATLQQAFQTIADSLPAVLTD